MNAEQFARKLLQEYPALEALTLEDLPGHIYMGEIKVKPEFRGQGVGTQVIQRIKSYAARRGLKLALVPMGGETQNQLQSYYGRLGFHTVKSPKSRFAYHDRKYTMVSENIAKFLGEAEPLGPTQQYLHFMADAKRDKFKQKKSMERFVLDHGHSFPVGPKSFPGGGKRNECYKNCFDLVHERPGLTYCEGWATPTGLIPLMHAWCVDETDTVVDPTWKGGSDYYGVPFNSRFLFQTALRRKYYGVIDDMEGEWPLVFGKVKKEEWAPQKGLPLAKA